MAQISQSGSMLPRASVVMCEWVRRKMTKTLPRLTSVNICSPRRIRFLRNLIAHPIPYPPRFFEIIGKRRRRGKENSPLPLTCLAIIHRFIHYLLRIFKQNAAIRGKRTLEEMTDDPGGEPDETIRRRDRRHRISTFTVEKGEVLGFLGPNGAGKTTTMKMLTCYLPPTAGTAKVCGFDILEQSMEVRKRIGYLPERNPLYGDMTVRGYLDFVAQVKGVNALGAARRGRPGHRAMRTCSRSPAGRSASSRRGTSSAWASPRRY